MAFIRPKKSLGQNYLIDKNIASKIVSLLNCHPDDIVVEIGPGLGILTEQLLKYSSKLIAVELDSNSVQLLKQKFSASEFNPDDELIPRISFVNQDIRNFNLLQLNFQSNNSSKINSSHSNIQTNHSPALKKKIKIIGNIPYNISADILFYLFNNSDLINRAVLTIQKEVASRLTAIPNTKEYGILTIAAGLSASVKKIFDISPHCFRPVPKVFSSVVILDFNKNTDQQLFHSVLNLVKAAFCQRRKLFKNSIKNYIESKCSIDSSTFAGIALERLGKDISKLRAEDFTIDDFIIMTNIIDELKYVQ
jgi:16S rRNA (adenine1518-N6/adenine1519-N6)-dimethyltransferase